MTFEPIEASVLRDFEDSTTWTAICMTEGTPVPNITWFIFHYNSSLQLNESYPPIAYVTKSVSGNVATSTLILPNITIEAMETRLVCFASNRVTSTSQSQMPYLACKKNFQATNSLDVQYC